MKDSQHTTPDHGGPVAPHRRRWSDRRRMRRPALFRPSFPTLFILAALAVAVAFLAARMRRAAPPARVGDAPIPGLLPLPAHARTGR